jgi:hypothetical protein
VGLCHASADANRIVAFSLFGEVYVTEDGGASWRKIAREFGEIRAAVWVPTREGIHDPQISKMAGSSVMLTDKGSARLDQTWRPARGQ